MPSNVGPPNSPTVIPGCCWVRLLPDSWCPAALIIVFALTTSEKIVVMGTWLAWVLIIMGFLMVVEFMRDSIRRQTELGSLSDESIRAMLYGHKAKRRDTSAERHEEADPSAAVTAIIPTIPPTKEGRHAR